MVSNVPKERLTDGAILNEYKDQWVVEDKYKSLKKPVVLGPIWLQKKERITRLIFVLLLSVLVSLYICYHIDSSLKNEGNPVKEALPAVKEKDIVKKGYVAYQKILTSDGRLVEKPTYKVIFGALSALKVLGVFEGDKLVFKFGYGTPIRLLQMVELIEFNPSIYIKPFSLKMDIWKYYKNPVID